MSTMQLLLLVAVTVMQLASVYGKNDLHRGFNGDIDWHNMEDGMKKAKEENKMIFMLIHKSWCGACKSLKPQFTTSMEIQSLAEKFVMVNIMDDEEPKEKEYQPDGGYIPRILFLDSRSKVKREWYNKAGNPQYKYFYSNPTAIVSTMREVISHKQANPEL